MQEQAAKRATPPSDYPVESLKPGASSREDAPDYSFPASWPRTDEPKLAGHERRTVKIEMYAPTGAFLVGDAVRLPGRNDVLEVIGEPESYGHNPFGWAPGLEVVNLGGIR